MDLTSFTSKKIESVEEVIIDNDEVKIIKNGDEVSFFFKKKEAIEKYQNFLFFSPTESKIIDSESEANDFFRKSLDDGVEGLMFKKLDSDYVPGLRVGSMAKLKETKEDIDVVILGAEFGQGKRAGFYSSFLVGVKNDFDSDGTHEFLQIGKVSSGIHEKDDGVDGRVTLENISKLLEPLKIGEENGLSFFEPKIVIQVRYQEIQKSNSYNSGFALRFPRIITLREDKVLDEINSLSDIKNFSNY